MSVDGLWQPETTAHGEMLDKTQLNMRETDVIGLMIHMLWYGNPVILQREACVQLQMSSTENSKLPTGRFVLGTERQVTDWDDGKFVWYLAIRADKILKENTWVCNQFSIMLTQKYWNLY